MILNTFEYPFWYPRVLFATFVNEIFIYCLKDAHFSIELLYHDTFDPNGNMLHYRTLMKRFRFHNFFWKITWHFHRMVIANEGAGGFKNGFSWRICSLFGYAFVLSASVINTVICFLFISIENTHNKINYNATLQCFRDFSLCLLMNH